MDITTMGALIDLTDKLITTLGGLSKFISSLGIFTPRENAKQQLNKVTRAFSEYQARLQYLADQLQQSETLTRMVPSWLELANRMPFWQDVTNMSKDEIRMIEKDIRSLIHESIRDHFSSTFFSKNFDKLPGVNEQLIIFRAKLEDLDDTLRGIDDGDTQVFKLQWHKLRTEFGNTRNTADSIQLLAEDIQGKLIHELKESASRSSH